MTCKEWLDIFLNFVTVFFAAILAYGSSLILNRKSVKNDRLYNLWSTIFLNISEVYTELNNIHQKVCKVSMKIMLKEDKDDMQFVDIFHSFETKLYKIDEYVVILKECKINEVILHLLEEYRKECHNNCKIICNKAAQITDSESIDKKKMLFNEMLDLKHHKIDDLHSEIIKLVAVELNRNGLRK